MLCSGRPFLTTTAKDKKQHVFIDFTACKRDCFFISPAGLCEKCVAVFQNIMLAACSFPLSVTLLQHLACAHRTVAAALAAPQVRHTLSARFFRHTFSTHFFDKEPLP
jgi:hypothetical protein